MARRRGPADLRAHAWHANALLLIAEGNRPEAKRSVSHGLRVIQEHLASLGGTELRARAAGQGSEVARLGVRLALDDKRPNELLRCAERLRASSLRYPPVRPPEDDWLVADLAELRRLRSQLRETRPSRVRVPTTSKGQRSRLKPGFGDVCWRLGESKWKAANSMSPIFAVPSTADYWWSTSASRVGSTPSR